MRYAIENPYAFEAEEQRDALRHSTASCAPNGHDWASNHSGGGICLDCGLSVSGDEL